MVTAAGRPGAWHLSAPEPVGTLHDLLPRLAARAPGAALAIGVDFPLGLPRAYAAALDLPDFRTFLDSLASGPLIFPDFFDVCDSLDQVGRDRPFYPRRGIAGMSRAAHAAALGLDGPEHLSRLCDRATAERPAGAPLFWTLGANQTGKAAISAWRDWLIPARAGAAGPRLWPFEGNFLDLLDPARPLVAETYPAEALRQLGLRLPGSKRRQSDRAGLAEPLSACIAAHGGTVTDALRAEMLEGFGADAAGEDRFDCLLGLLCVLLVLHGERADGVPDDPAIRHWEGWVLGQMALPLSRSLRSA